MKVELEFVETPEQHDLWETFRVKTSSVMTRRNPGRNIRILVKEKTTQKYLGILSLASDLSSYTSRDTYIGWNATDKYDKKRLNYVVNIACCVGLPPTTKFCNTYLSPTEM